MYNYYKKNEQVILSSLAMKPKEVIQWPKLQKEKTKKRSAKTLYFITNGI